jgi:hypothetical protein
VAPDPAAALAWWDTSPWPPLAEAHRQWDAYCVYVEGIVHGVSGAVFGACVRCGSKRVIVMNDRGG